MSKEFPGYVPSPFSYNTKVQKAGAIDDCKEWAANKEMLFTSPVYRLSDVGITEKMAKGCDYRFHIQKIQKEDLRRVQIKAVLHFGKVSWCSCNFRHLKIIRLF